MPSPRNATTAPGGSRVYTWRGEAFHSVTTILGGGVPKPALINWAKKFVATYAVEHVDSLVVLAKDDPEGAIGWLKDSPWRDRDKKADLGTALHEAMEAYSLGKPFPKWGKDIEPRMNQFVAFLETMKPIYEMTEASVYNRTQRYAGTLDAIITLEERPATGPPWHVRYILDMKSGKGVYEEVALQLAAYRYAEFVGLPNGDEAPMPQVDGACALHLTDDFWELIEVQADEEVFRYFLHVREVYRWEKEGKKGVLRGPMKVADPGVQALGQMLIGEADELDRKAMIERLEP